MTLPGIIKIDRFVKRSPASVWKALTDPTILARWWVAGDLRPSIGHLFELDMGQWGRQKCEILAVECESLLKFRFAIDFLDSIVTWELQAEGEGTRLSLTHDDFDLGTPMGKMAFEGMMSGWPNLLAKLETVLGAYPAL